MTFASVLYRACSLGGDRRGQDLVEYALMAGFVAVVGGTIFPTTFAPALSIVFSKVFSVMDASAGL